MSKHQKFMLRLLNDPLTTAVYTLYILAMLCDKTDHFIILYLYYENDVV